MKSRFARLVVRLLLAVVPIAWVLHKIDARTVQESIRAVGGVVFVLTSLLPFASASVAPLRWRVLLRAYGATGPLPLSTLWRYNLVGAYFNALPGAIAGDALRAVRTARMLPGTADSAAVVLVERVAGLVGLLLLGATSLVWGAPEHESVIAGTLAIGAALSGALAVAICASPAAYRRLVREPPRSRLLARVDGIVRRIPTPRSLMALVVAVLISLLTQGLPMIQTLGLAAALAPEVPTFSVVFVLPAIILLTYIPITPAAVGQREVVYVRLLGSVGVAPDVAVAISLIVLVSSLVPMLIGGVVHLTELAFGWEDAPVPPDPNRPPDRLASSSS